MRLRERLTLILFLMVLTPGLAACGGGGGGGGDDAGGFDPDERPRLLATLPVDGATDVAATEPVEFIFRDPLEPATIDPQQITVLADGVPVIGSVEYMEATRRLYFFPASPLPASSAVRATLHAGYADRGGVERETDVVVRFDVAGGTAGLPDPVENVTDPTRVIQMEANEAGDGFLLMLRTETPTVRSLWARRIVGGTTLQNAVLLDRGENLMAGGRRGMAVSASGDALVTYRITTAGDDRAYARYFDAQTGTWRARSTLEATPGNDAGYPQVVMDDAGSALLTWTAGPHYQQEQLRVAQYGRSQGLSPVQSLSGPASEVSGEHLHGTANSLGIVVWSRKNAQDRYDVHCSIYNPFAGGWSAAQLLDDYDAHHALRPHGFIDPQGHAALLWEQWDANAPEDATVWGRLYDPVQGFDAPIQLDGTARRYREVRGHTFPGGGGHVVFSRSDVPNPGLVAYPWTQAGGWQASVDLHEGTPGGMRYTALHLIDRADGRVAVAWSQSHPDMPGNWLTLALRDTNGVWSRPVHVGETGYPTFPNAAIAWMPDGGVQTMWMQRWQGQDIHDRARARRVHPNGSMDAPRTLNTDDGRFVIDFHLIMGPTGQGLAAWTQFTAGFEEADAWTARVP